MTYNVICDHIRMLSFAIADGVLPSNEGRGYVVRRVLRRASKFVMNLDIKEPILYKLVQSVVSTMSDAYPELKEKQTHIEQTILNEEKSFLFTLEKGVLQFEKIVKNSSNSISGSDAFKLYDTYGFPLDLTELMADEQGMSVDKKGFDKEMQKQKDLAKSSQKFTFDRSNVKWMLDNQGSHSEFVGYDSEESKSKIVKWGNENSQVFVVLDRTPFYAESGGQVGDSGSIENKDFSLKVVDTQKSGDFIIHICDLETGSLSENLNVDCRIDSSRRKDIKANHSATHLLHQALKDILGSHINQAGSLVGPDYLRFDFTHPNKLGRKDIEAIDLLVNDKIAEDIPVTTEIKTLDDAKQEGAMALFGEKYGEKVRVLTMGSFSKELCGGTHVSATGEIDKFMITQDKAIASGVRRIHALTGQHIGYYLQDKMDTTSRLQEASEKKEREKKSQSDMLNAIDIDKMIENQKHLNSIPFINEEVALESTDGLKKLNKKLNTKFKSGIAVFSTSINENKTISVGVSKDLIEKSLSAGYLAKCIAEKLGGGGGGKDDFAMAGTSSEFSLNQIKSVIDETIKNELKKI